MIYALAAGLALLALVAGGLVWRRMKRTERDVARLKDRDRHEDLVR